MAGSGAGAAASFCTGSALSICEDFDTGSTTCGDDASSQANCTASSTAWVEGHSDNAGTITNQGTGLEGVYAKIITAGSSPSLQHTTSAPIATATSPLYAFARLKIGAITTGIFATANSLFGIRSLSAGLCNLAINNDGKWVVYSNGGFNAAEATGPTQDTEYYIWINYTKNSASGCDIRIAETGTKPETSTFGPYQTANTDADRVRINSYSRNSYGSFSPVTFDKLKVSTSAIGND